MSAHWDNQTRVGVEMGYVTEYDCHVQCLNGELDAAGLINGTIQSTTGHLCNIGCVDAPAASNGTLIDPLALTAVIVLVVVTFVIFRTMRLGEKKTGE